MWEVMSVQPHSPEMHKLLEKGWEPFAVSVDVYSARRATMWLRRNPSPQSNPAVTRGMSENGIG